MFSWSKSSKHNRVAHGGEMSASARNPQLQIRSVLEDPALRRLMGLDQAPIVATVKVRPMKPRPQRPFGRRQLLESAAA